MNALPLHPAIVHLPLGLAILMPVCAAGFAWALWTGRVRSRAWFAVIAFQGVLLGAALLAINTGGAEEDRVEGIVQESVLHQHEELAEQFAWASGATLALSVLVLVFRRPIVSRALTAAVVLATVAVAALGVRVGRAGGELVYVYGAATAYASPAPAGAGKPSAPRHDRDRDDEKARVK